MRRDNADTFWKRAVAYVRMSTEHLQYSTSNQMDVIKEYAQRHGFEIVKVYSDDGKSGLNIEGRESLGEMIREVKEGRANYSHILVYDVSRWGRFQDPDQNALLEYIWRSAGVALHHCAEQVASAPSYAFCVTEIALSAPRAPRLASKCQNSESGFAHSVDQSFSQNHA